MDLFYEEIKSHLQSLCSGSDQKADLAEVSDLISQLAIDDKALSKDVAHGFSEIWFRFLDYDKYYNLAHKDRPAQIAILASFLAILSHYNSLAEASFVRTNRWFEKSVVELKLRLIARLYKYSRRVAQAYSNSTDASACLVYGLRIAELSTAEMELLSKAQRSTLLGFRGAMRDFLSRYIPSDQFSYWHQAWEDIKQSYELGNRNPEAEMFMRGILVQRFVHSEGLELLEESLQYLRDLKYEDVQSRGEFVTLLTTAAPRLASIDIEKALFFAEQGIQEATVALVSTNQTINEVHFAYLKNQRAFLRKLKLHNMVDLSSSDKLTVLSEIIEDYSASYVHNLGGSELADCLIRRAHLYFESKQFDECDRDACLAREKLKMLDKEKEAVFVARAESMRHKVKFRKAIEISDLTSAANEIDHLIELSPESDFHLVYVLSSLLEIEGLDSPIHRKFGDALSRILAHAKNVVVKASSGDSAFFIASYAANLSRRMEPEPSEATLDIYRLAIQVDTINRIEPLIFAGNIALDIGKRLACGRGVDPAGIFEEATQFYESSLVAFEANGARAPEFVVGRTIYSKAGEAYIRYARHASAPLSAYLRAKDLLTESWLRGNETAANFGMLGDVLYRIGVIRRDRESLILAGCYKKKARELDPSNVMRENLSVSSRIAERIYWFTNDTSTLAESIALAISACARDPFWAWPYFQVWEMMCRYRGGWEAIMELVPEFLEMVPRSEVFEAIKCLDVDFFSSLGTLTACASREFRRETLGGRSAVFLIDDDHGLLGSTVVLKPTRRSDAEREKWIALKLAESIKNAGADRRLSVVEPVCIVPINPAWELEVAQDKEVIFSTRLASGRDLGREVVALSRRGAVLDMKIVTEVVNLLTLFHKLEPTEWLRCGSEQFFQFLSTGTLKNFRGLLKHAIEPLVDCVIPQAHKKDAHAENWILSDDARIVAIDLEASTIQPVLADLSQWFDDYPVLPPTKAGLVTRYDLAEKFIAQFEASKILRSELELCVDLFALWRVSFMKGFLSRKMSKENSVSRLRAYELRKNHMNELALTLSEHASTPAMQKLARALTAVS